MKSTNNNLIKRDDKVLEFKFPGGTASESDAVYIGDVAGLGIKTGIHWATGDVTVLVGLTEDDPYFAALKDKDGSAYTLSSVAANDARTIDANLYPWHWAKLKSSVNQTTKQSVMAPAKT